jgi:hypothetical protein
MGNCGSSVRPANVSRATTSNNGLKSVATVSGVTATVQVIRQPPGASAVYQRAPEPTRRAAEYRDNLVQRRRFLPRITVQVDVVVSQPLLGGQARTRTPVRGLLTCDCPSPSGASSARRAPRLVVMRGGHMFEPGAWMRGRARASRAWRPPTRY